MDDRDSLIIHLEAMLKESYFVSVETLSAATRLAELGIDSLTLVEFVFELEDRYGVVFPEDLSQLLTVGDVASLLAALIAKKPV